MIPRTIVAALALVSQAGAVGAQLISVAASTGLEIRLAGATAGGRGVLGMARLSDGSLVVVDSTSPYLSVFDSRGTRRADGLGVTGGRGRILWLGASNDSVFLFDADAREVITYYRGAIARSAGRWQDSLATWYPMGRLSTGAFLVRPTRWSTRVRGVNGFRTDVLLALVGPGDVTPVEIGVHPYHYLAVLRPSGFAPSPLHGTLHVALEGGRAWIGDSDQHTIRAYDQQGRSVGFVELPSSLERFDPARVSAAREAELHAASPERKAAVAQLFNTDRLPPRQPAYGQLIADTNGDLWVKQYDVARFAESRYYVMRSGQVHTTVALPSGVTPFYIDSDYLLGIRGAETGQESLVLLSVQRR
jgi:hypothetical protein